MAGQVPETLEQVLREAAEENGSRVLLVCQDKVPAGAPDLPRVTVRASSALLEGADAPAQRFDLALVLDSLEHLSRDDGSRLLAALRDRWARRLLVVVPGPDAAPGATCWRLQDMLAHGLEARGAARTGSGAVVALYGFDIDRYKRTPDWLNARNWANPELWGRYRW